jgi:hypothetical protein
MGFLTNVSISNDYWHEISRKPQQLADAISIGMNYGIDSPLHKAINAKYEKDDFHDNYVNKQTPQGVTVHQARHFDEPQVIVNTYGFNPVNAAEVGPAIDLGWLGFNKYNRTHAEHVAEELEQTAKLIRAALKKNP